MNHAPCNVRKMESTIAGIFFFALVVLISPAQAGDWPQIHGPQRDGHALGERLADTWKLPPQEKWNVAVGQGYAGPAVVQNRVFIFHRKDKKDVLDCLAADTGDNVWSLNWPAKYRGGIDADTGPRSVPVVQAGRVYLWTADGTLHCTTTTGEKRWSRQLGKEFAAQDGYFGFGSTPIVINGKVIVNVGGKKASIVALDAASGEDVWSQFKDAASYAPPIKWNYGGRACVVFITRLNLVALEPDDGEVLFQVPFGARGPTVNAAAPVIIGPQQIFVTASYRIGAKLLSLENNAPTIVWESDRALSSQYPTPIFQNGFLYGVHGREDGPAASLRCIEARTGKVQWERKGVGMAHAIVAGQKLLIQTTEGELWLLRLTPQRFDELGRIRLSGATTRALPALSNGKLFVRSTDGTLAAWQLP